jgi:hypothetical protein
MVGDLSLTDIGDRHTDWETITAITIITTVLRIVIWEGNMEEAAVIITV